MKKIFKVLVFLFLNLPLYSQYYQQEVLQRSFEQMDFFFVPNRLNPYAFSGFASTVTGVVDDPILNLNLNPASFKFDSASNYFYMDFRNSAYAKVQNYDVYPVLEYGRDSRFAPTPFPRYFANKREIPDPIISAAFFSNKIISEPNLFLGITYQLIFQNEKYYSVPYDIYTSALGSDYSGKSLISNENYPVIDKYNGVDNMHISAHKLNYFLGYRLSDDLQIGATISQIEMKRNGSYGSTNLWEYNQLSNSYWHNLESRTQNYNHLDYSVGFDLKLNEQTNLGFSFGILNGESTQNFNNVDTSSYNYNSAPSYKSESFHKALKEQNWNNKGKTNYFAIILNRNISDKQKVRFHYYSSAENTDITLSSVIDDTSKYYYYSVYNNLVYENNSFYRLTDKRNGSGTTKSKFEKFSFAYDWKVTDVTRIELGFNLGKTSENTITTEPTLSYTNNYSLYTSNNSTTLSKYNLKESKNLNWEFDFKKTVLQIPIIFHFNEGEKYSYIFGFNRQMSDWEISDNVIAYYNYKNEAVNDKTTHKENFGERYTMPKENITSVTTSILAGAEFSSPQKFTVRLLFAPTIKDNFGSYDGIQFNWWLGIILRP